MAVAHVAPPPEPRGDVRELSDGLFRLAPEDFVAARDRLARRLRASGRPEDAAAVKRLGRPTRAAWALNQVARRDPVRVRGLLDAARDLRVAQDDALAGGSGTDLRAAQREWRRHVLDVVGDAQQVLASAGAPVNAHVAALTSLVESVAAEPDLADDLGAGRLSGHDPDPDQPSASGPSRGPAAVVALDPRRPKVVRHLVGGAADRRRTEERDRLVGDLEQAHRRLETARTRCEESAATEAGAEEQLAEDRRRLEAAETALRRATIERHRAEREVLAATRSARQIEERLAQVAELLAVPRRSSRR